jgi:hypothetical protein
MVPQLFNTQRVYSWQVNCMQRTSSLLSSQKIYLKAYVDLQFFFK